MTAIGRVGVNASIVGENPTGLGLYSVNLVGELDRLRDDLLVYTSRPKAFGQLRARLGWAPAGVRPERGLRGHLRRLLWLQSELRVRARTDRLGVVLNTVPEGILGSPIPQVAIVHDLLPLFIPAEYPRQQYYFRFLVPRILRASRVVIADSESTRRGVIQHYVVHPEKVRVVYPGYDPGVFFSDGFDPSRARHEDPYCLYVGNLLPHKNLLRLLDSLAILRRRRACRLIIRGEGRPDYARTLRERVETLGLTDVVTFLGYMTGPALRELYAGAACVVLPSLGEGFGLPVLEAMACGTPVVVSGTTSLPEVAGEAGLRVDPHDAIGMMEAIYRLLTDVGLREELRQRGLQRVRSFSWRRTSEQVSQILDEVLSTTGADGSSVRLDSEVHAGGAS